MKYLIAILALVAGIFAGMHWARRSYVNVAADEQQNKITRVINLIQSDYVDSVSLDSITEVIIPQLMSTLDPHSVYIPAKEFDAVNESLQGGFGGIGIRFMMLTDTATVTNVIDGGPSQRAGVRNGDRILRVDTTSIVKMASEKVMKLLRGEIGTTTELYIERAGAREKLSVTRGQVPIPSITAAFALDPQTGYIKLDQFSRTTHDEVRDAVRLLKRQGIKRLVLDLRGNPGGYLDQAEKLANEFLPADKMIVYTEDKHRKRSQMHSNGQGEMTDIPLAIVVDQNSASSSEIVAGAVQDNDRGLIVGRRTFGKGLVQEQVSLPDGSALRLTVARYFTPTGRSIQKPLEGDYAAETYMRNGEFFSADSVKLADSLKFTTPRGRTVYGGGGIMPDVFVPLDTMFMTDFYLHSYALALPTLFALRWADGHRAQINSVRTVEDLNKMLVDFSLEEFVKFAALKGVRPRTGELDKSRAELSAIIRGEIGRFTPLGEAGFFSQYYAVDQPLRVAVKKIVEKI